VWGRTITLVRQSIWTDVRSVKTLLLATLLGSCLCVFGQTQLITLGPTLINGGTPNAFSTTTISVPTNVLLRVDGASYGIELQASFTAEGTNYNTRWSTDGGYNMANMKQDPLFVAGPCDLNLRNGSGASPRDTSVHFAYSFENTEGSVALFVTTPGNPTIHFTDSSAVYRVRDAFRFNYQGDEPNWYTRASGENSPFNPATSTTSLNSESIRMLANIDGTTVESYVPPFAIGTTVPGQMPSSSITFWFMQRLELGEVSNQQPSGINVNVQSSNSADGGWSTFSTLSVPTNSSSTFLRFQVPNN
jgi:hypothetical protein